MFPVTHTEMIKLLLSPGCFLLSFPWSTSTLAHGFLRSGTLSFGQTDLYLYSCPDFGEFAWLFPGKNPHLLFQVREGKDHSSPSALAVFLGLSPLQCSFLGLHKLHPYHPSLICALGSTREASVTPLHLETGSTSCFPCHTLVVGIL